MASIFLVKEHVSKRKPTHPLVESKLLYLKFYAEYIPLKFSIWLVAEKLTLILTITNLFAFFTSLLYGVGPRCRISYSSLVGPRLLILLLLFLQITDHPEIYGLMTAVPK